MIVAFHGVQPLDAVGPLEVFAGASRAAASLGRAGGYRVTLASTGGGTCAPRAGSSSAPSRCPEPAAASTPWCSPGGDGRHAAAADEALLAWIRPRRPGPRRVATVCSGTFIAAAAGLLDGRRVTTHWARARS